MEKVYKAHEIAYQKIKKKGAESWREMYANEEIGKVDHIGINRKNFIDELRNQDWFPKNGSTLEIGCGTGHLIRYITSFGFSGTGIDVSKTAIELAKSQTKSNNINFFHDDYCYTNILDNEKFDLIIDGSCFHCIVEDKDREIFIQKSKSLLKENGVFILFTMCSPIDKKGFYENFKTQKLYKNIFYVPHNIELEGSKIFNNKLYMAQRKIVHWKSILQMLNKNGFKINLFRYEQEKVFSNIYIASQLK